MNFGVRVVQHGSDHRRWAATPSRRPTTARPRGTAWIRTSFRCTTNRNYTDVLPSFNFVLDVTDTQKVQLRRRARDGAAGPVPAGSGQFLQLHPRRQRSGHRLRHASSSTAALRAIRTSIRTARRSSCCRTKTISPGRHRATRDFYKQVDSFVETENIATFVNDDFGGTTAQRHLCRSTPARARSTAWSWAASTPSRSCPWLQGFGWRRTTRARSLSPQQPTASRPRGPIPGVSKTPSRPPCTTGTPASRPAPPTPSATRRSTIAGGIHLRVRHQNLSRYSQAPYGQLDAQVSYDFNVHFGVVVSVQNLTDAAQHTYLQWPDLPFTYDDRDAATSSA